MFKISRARILSTLVWLLALTGCQGLRPLPPANFHDPGWTLREGQAVWHLPNQTAEIAGELLLATRTNGEAFVQFSKPPFTVLAGRITPHRWEIEFPPQDRRYGGPGKPPKRLAWLHLPSVLNGAPAPKGWSWRIDQENWRFENSRSGEFLEGYFSPAAAP